jgi:catechol-2,3-dioxygenase
MADINEAFEIRFLDHVAIRVKDLKISSEWYQNVLGLKKYQLPEWGDFPIFMLANKSGIALFPANTSDTEIDPMSKNVKIDHFAFNVTQENFERALKRYEKLNLEYQIKDHHYFKSIYIKDPDGHAVELTTIQVNESDFYDQ